MGTNSNKKCSLLFLAEQIGIKLGRFCLAGLTLFSFPESRNLEKLILHPSEIIQQLCHFVSIQNCHCSELAASDLTVRCGEWDLFQEDNGDELYKHQDRQVQFVSIHPWYIHALNGKRKLYNDIAILHTEHEFELAPNLDTICLPTIPEQREQNYDPSNCVVVGWGKDAPGDLGNFQQAMKQVNLSIVDNDECQDKLRQTRLGSNFILNKSFLCAGGEEGKDSCEGDGGGPLVCADLNNPDKFVLGRIFTRWARIQTKSVVSYFWRNK